LGTECKGKGRVSPAFSIHPKPPGYCYGSNYTLLSIFFQARFHECLAFGFFDAAGAAFSIAGLAAAATAGLTAGAMAASAATAEKVTAANAAAIITDNSLFIMNSNFIKKIN